MPDLLPTQGKSANEINGGSNDGKGTSDPGKNQAEGDKNAPQTGNAPSGEGKQLTFEIDRRGNDTPSAAATPDGTLDEAAPQGGADATMQEREQTLTDLENRYGVRFERRKMRHASGTYGYTVGSLAIDLRHCRTTDDVRRTFLHEYVGHMGIHALLGDEAFNKFCKAVALRIPIKGVAMMRQQYGGFDRLPDNVKGAEFLAVLAEKGDEYTRRGAFADLWNDAKGWLNNMIYKSRIQ